MGLLTRDDSLIFRKYFSEMCKLLGQSVGYQYVTKKDVTIHSEDNSEFSMPIRIDILFDDNPSIDTLNRIGWVSELNEQQPIIANLSYNTPHLTVGARIIIGSVEGTDRPRVFSVTKIASDLEFPDAYTCALVPVFDQYKQKNQYTLVNTEKMNEEDSKRTSQDQPSKYFTGEHDIDNVPEEYKKWQEEYTFIDDKNSPYSG